MKSSKTKNKKQLLYEDFMADFFVCTFLSMKLSKECKI